MELPVTAVDDANILYPAPVRDLFIRLAQAGLVRARWTEAIHEEWIRTVHRLDNCDGSTRHYLASRGMGINRTNAKSALSCLCPPIVQTSHPG
jgi:hypothetical protein